MPREKNAKPVQHAPKSNALRNILDSAQALAKGVKEQSLQQKSFSLQRRGTGSIAKTFPMTS